MKRDYALALFMIEHFLQMSIAVQMLALLYPAFDSMRRSVISNFIRFSSMTWETEFQLKQLFASKSYEPNKKVFSFHHHLL